MELVQEFVVPRPINTAWAILTDIERIAPCMPGAQLQEVEGDTYRGVVRVKVGPVLANFGGQAQFRELNEHDRRVVLHARGKEARGQGLASALITAQLTEEGEQTRVNVVTNLTISGRLAQFGRGAMAEISEKLLGQFVDCLESTVLAEEDTSVSPVAPPVAMPGAQPPAAAVEPTVPPAQPPAAAAEPTVPPAQPTVPPAQPTPAEPTADAIPTTDGETQPPQEAAATVRRIEGPDAKPVDLIQTAGAPILKRLIPVVILVAAVIVALVLLLS